MAYLFLVRPVTRLVTVTLVVCSILSNSTGFGQRNDSTPAMLPTPPAVNFPPGAQVRAVAISAPKAGYPLEARKHHWVGVGWYVMHVDKKTGLVTSVEILQSTGHAILDRAAVNALKRWRFDPHRTTVSKVKTPITFAMSANDNASR